MNPNISNYNKHDKPLLLTERQLNQIIQDLFTAGTESNSTTMKWALIYMLHHPDIQTKVQKEIAEVIGAHRMPSMKDKTSMPYTEACILELQRMADIAPLAVPHVVTEDIVFRGYNIPKDTAVFPFLHGVHRDPKVWKEPFTFNPEHFLDDNGSVCNREKIIPFGMGKILWDYSINLGYRYSNIFI